MSFFVWVAAIILSGCAQSYKTVGEETTIKCVGGVGFMQASNPKFAKATPSGTVIVCGNLEKKISPTKYEMSELDIYLHKKDSAVHLLKTSATQKRIVELKNSAELEVTENLQNGSAVFHRKIICTAETCGLGPDVCAMKKEEIEKTMAENLSHDKELLQKAKEICK